MKAPSSEVCIFTIGRMTSSGSSYFDIRVVLPFQIILSVDLLPLVFLTPEYLFLIKLVYCLIVLGISVYCLLFKCFWQFCLLSIIYYLFSISLAFFCCSQGGLYRGCWAHWCMLLPTSIRGNPCRVAIAI